MPTLAKQHAVLLSKNSLEIVGIKDKLEFPQDLIVDLKISDEEVLKSRIVEFLAKLDVKQKVATILLEDELIFAQTVPLTNMDDVKKQSEEFFKNLPLDQGLLAKKTLTNDKEVYLIATNGAIFEVVRDAFAAASWTVQGVVPLSLFFVFSKKDPITPKEVEGILKNDTLIATADFLSEEKEEEKGNILGPSVFSEKKSSGSKKWILIAAAVVILLFLGLFLHPIQNIQKLTAKPTPTPAPTSTPTPTPTVIPKDKGTLTVHILNGTGTPGQASQVKSVLVGLKYTSSNVTTDNGSTSDNQTTSITF